MCMQYSLIRRLASYKVCLCFIMLSVTARVHNKGKEREYLILTLPVQMYRVKFVLLIIGFSRFVLTLSGQQKT